MKVLVTGGAGYIGSHVVKELIKEGNEVVVFDNLSTGYKKAVDHKAVFVEGNLENFSDINSCILKNKPDAVMHFAGFIEAGESVIKPEKYFKNNVVNGINLLNAMVKNNVKKLVFSSSAGIYGNPEKNPVKENHEKNPVNPYGEAKLMFENILKWYDIAHNIKSVSLRYFNAAGSGYNLGENHNPETHIIPLILQTALGVKDSIKIHGTDYDTKDGTCVRDYIHVIDLAKAHILALNKLRGKSLVYNLGNGIGYSVKEIIDKVKEITGKDFSVIESARRMGDPAILIADYSKAKKELGWKPEFELKDIIRSAWEWHSNNLRGYDDKEPV